MKYCAVTMLLIFMATLPLTGQVDFPKYYTYSDLSATSPGALKFGLYGYDNPALLSYLRQPDLQFTWTDAAGRWNDFNRWGLFMAGPNLGFDLVKTKIPGASVMDYRIATAFGDRAFSLGLGFGWSGGDKAQFNRSNVWTIGTLIRPNPYVSVGLTGSTATSGNGKEAVFDVAARPLGNEIVTLFADYSIQNDQSLKDGGWSMGAALEALPGIRIVGRYFDTKAFTLGLEFSLGNAGLAAHSTYDRDGKHSFNTYSVRLGAYDRTVLTGLMKKSRYLEIDLLGPLRYQRYVWFDRSHTLSRILETIQAAKSDETVAGIAINTSGMTADREMLWEIREQLKDFRSAGKKVVIFVDRLGIDEYHFASVADRIVLDPTGVVMLQGYSMGRTFLKGTLEKLGIGFDEWRYFKYKSAVEVLSRDKMSEPDREQRQKLVEDFYRLAKADICQSRNLTLERFDTLVNDEVMFLPQEAVKQGLVDTLGRWEDVDAMVERIEGGRKSLVSPMSLAKFNLPYDNLWGERPKIALIYALGVCEMDAGIKARTLWKVIEAAGKDPKVKAIVLRVDSPGGDGMASDYVAEAVKKARKSKPVIISQGTVAASGGYWLSMYGDTIVAAPNTITGSIGVIGGWMYNKELKEKLGMSTDLVAVGKHADLGFGFSLPFLGLGIPDRDLNDVERAKIERIIRSYYQEFVQKVAEGRHRDYNTIDAVAQGRVWSGYDGKEVGLVDLLGGLETALQVAREKARIPEDREAEIIEMPKLGLFDLSALLPGILGTEDLSPMNKTVEHLKFLLKHNGEPMPVMPIDEIEFGGE